MSQVVQIQTTVLPGKRIIISSPEFEVGDHVDVTIAVCTLSDVGGHRSAPEKAADAASPDVMPRGQSILEFVESLPEGRLFKTPEEADQYLKAERDSWDH